MSTKDSARLGVLLAQLERVTHASSFVDTFTPDDRIQWQSACSRINCTGDLVYCLYSFEQSVKISQINTKWVDHRKEWEDSLLASETCNTVALALYDFESHMLWKAVLDSWRKDRKIWATSIRSLYPPPLRVLSDCLLLLEKNIGYDVLSQRWRGERAKWTHRARFCRCTQELSTAVLLFATRLSESAMIDQWRLIRDEWTRKLQRKDINYCMVAILLLQQERSMLPSSFSLLWKSEFRTNWVLALEQIAHVGK